MPYANTSPVYRIPYMASGELSSGASNRRAVLIIDSQIQGSARIIGENGIIGDGPYAGNFVSGNSNVTLAAVGPNFALEAMIGGEYIAQNTTLTWTGLPNSSTIY